MVRAEMNGESAPELIAQRTQLELIGDRYFVRFDGQITDRGTFELSANIEAKTLVLRGKTGPNAGRTIPCIYQLVGDRLRICYGLDGLAPTEFATAEKQPRYLATYRRK
jgi:uncharacterized protein (TIGR03067 family)